MRWEPNSKTVGSFKGPWPLNSYPQFVQLEQVSVSTLLSPLMHTTGFQFAECFRKVLDIFVKLIFVEV